MYKDMMDTIGFVSGYDPELGAAMQRELGRQQANIELIASENIVSPAVMAAGYRLPESGIIAPLQHQHPLCIFGINHHQYRNGELE